MTKNMDIIEQAAKRLAELRRAGVETAAEPSAAPATVTPSAVVPAATTAVAPPQPSVAETAASMSRRVELDMVRLAEKGIVTPSAARSNLADELRVVKRPLLRNAAGKGATPVRNANLIMITSAVPGEGKSFTAANLAMSIATELDHTVLLVDADVARPSLPEIFDLPPGKGLLDVLVEPELDLSQVMLRTNVEKLSILPSGLPHAHATELLASEAMANMLEELASRYSDRIIIFDSPPLLVTTEARTLASHMGQVVLVVRAERTTHSEVRHALAMIEQAPVKMLMLNQAADPSAKGYGYGYGYGYAYASKSSEGEAR
jgi:exopolysaccharide/PEP-CTERM locus tyrosine autokinase